MSTTGHMGDEERDRDRSAESGRRAGRTVSVAMASYNGAAFLGEQLASLAAQTRLPLELVVTDDCSTDDTEAVLAKFAETAPFPVRFVRNADRLGYPDNFLKAAGLCRGDYVAYCDQDDVWSPDKLDRCLSMLESHGALLVNHPLRVCDAAMQPVDLLTQGIHETHVSPPLTAFPFLGVGYGNSIVFARWLLDPIDPAARPARPGDTKPCDHDLWVYLLASVFGPVVHLAEPLVDYRRHETNVSSAPVVGFMGKLTALRTVPLDEYDKRASFYAECSDLFARVGPGLPAHLRGLAAKAADIYRRRADFFEDRVALYEDPPLRRIFPLARLVRAGAYPPGAPGLKSLLKDVVLAIGGVGVVLGRTS